jgi:Baseplate J-like protein
MTQEEEEDAHNFPRNAQAEVEADVTLTGNPDTLHVFVVREADLADTLSQVVDSTLSQTQAPPGTSAFAQARRKPKAILFDCMGVVLGILTISMMVLGAGALFWTTFVPDSQAQVVLVPQVWTVTVTHSIQSATNAPGLLQLLAPVPLTQSLSVATSGTAHIPARQATGTITFYNGAFESQTIIAGTTLRGRDGVVVVTDAAAIIPAARPTTPPTYGAMSVPAHALVPGAAGNITASDLDQACCATSVLAENLAPFTGGQDAQTYHVVAQADIDTTLRQLTPEVQEAVQARLRAALHAGEQLAPLPCQQHWTSSARAGQAASHVRVTFTIRCQGVVYQSAAIQARASTWLVQQGLRQTGMAVRIVGEVRVSLSSVALTQNEAILTFAASAMLMPDWKSHDLQHLTASVAGKTPADATAWLRRQAGLREAHVIVFGGTALPDDPARIHIVIELPMLTPTPELAGSPSP